MSGSAPTPAKPTALDALFPPRSQWLRPRRRGHLDRASQIAQSVVWTIECAREAGDTSPWRLRLEHLVAEIRRDALTSPKGPTIGPPSIQPVKRPDGKYRAIAVYGCKERVIASLTAEYLRRAFDADFLESSYAFRSPTGRPPPSHHDAFVRLADIRTSRSDLLWVAECDIQGFFDCVDHRVATESFSNAVSRASTRGTLIDTRARAAFLNFLGSYSFTGTARPGADEWFRRRSIDGKLKWPEVALRSIHRNLENISLGIPQGGAISCLIANLLLHDADVAVARIIPPADADGLYMRYCDDMVITHANEAACRRAFTEYLEALRKLKLPVHAPERAAVYSSKFWRAKSREPYVWGPKTSGPGVVPWVGFVGYQVRWDGLVRVRPDSLRRERDKIKDEVSRVVELLYRQHKGNNRSAKVSARQVVFRLQHRLIARSVGMKPVFELPPDDLGFCWCGGFRGLANKSLIGGQMRELDRYRRRQIQWAARVADKLLSGLPSTAKVRRRGGPRFFGYPWSYFSRFDRSHHFPSRRMRSNRSLSGHTAYSGETEPEPEG